MMQVSSTMRLLRHFWTFQENHTFSRDIEPQLLNKLAGNTVDFQLVEHVRLQVTGVEAELQQTPDGNHNIEQPHNNKAVGS